MSEEIKKLQQENEALKTALRNARQGARDWLISSREFAGMCKITPSQLSKWTEEPVKMPPDFID